MKITRVTILIGACVVITGLQGCLDETVNTTISSDGSSERIISMKRPGRTIPDKAFPQIPDSSWTVTWKSTPSDTSNPYECAALKKFPTPEALEQEYASLPDTGVMRIALSLKKHFQWFYTYFDYEETYLYRDPFAHVPVTDFLTQDEIKAVTGGSQADSLVKKLNRWEGRNYFEEVYGIVAREVRRLNDPRLSAEMFEREKDRLYATVVRKLEQDDSLKESRKKSGGTPLEGKTGGGKKSGAKDSATTGDEMVQWMREYFRTDAVDNLAHAVDSGVQSVEAKEARIKHPDTWTNIVRMPGLILSANGSAIEGNTVTWKFNPWQVRVADYRMTASSRVSNTWAFVVTGIAAVAFVLVVTFGRFRGRRGL